MAKLTIVDVYKRAGEAIHLLSTNQLTTKQARDRFVRLSRSAGTLGLSLTVPTTDQLRALVPSRIEVPALAPVAPVSDSLINEDYEASSDASEFPLDEDYDQSYEESYESSHC